MVYTIIGVASGDRSMERSEPEHDDESDSQAVQGQVRGGGGGSTKEW